MPRIFSRTYRVDSTPVQGDGSFVEFKRLTWAEMEPFLGEKAEDRRFDYLAARIVDWNWTDEQGAALAHDAESLRQLVSDEVTWLFVNVETGPDAKN